MPASLMNGWNNKLFYGDNLDSLRKHVGDETVELCYSDPAACPQVFYRVHT
jgi:hypothetical protein